MWNQQLTQKIATLKFGIMSDLIQDIISESGPRWMWERTHCTDCMNRASNLMRSSCVPFIGKWSWSKGVIARTPRSMRSVFISTRWLGRVEHEAEGQVCSTSAQSPRWDEQTDLLLQRVLAFIPYLFNDFVNKYGICSEIQPLGLSGRNISAVGGTRFLPRPLLPLKMSSSWDNSLFFARSNNNL